MHKLNSAYSDGIVSVMSHGYQVCIRNCKNRQVVTLARQKVKSIYIQMYMYMLKDRMCSYGSSVVVGRSSVERTFTVVRESSGIVSGGSVW
jgi:hypothetical protein